MQHVGKIAEDHKYEHVEKVHDTENRDRKAYFRAKEFNAFFKILRLIAIFKGQHDEAKINKIEAYQQQMVHRIGERHVTTEMVI